MAHAKLPQLDVERLVREGIRRVHLGDPTGVRVTDDIFIRDRLAGAQCAELGALGESQPSEIRVLGFVEQQAFEATCEQEP
jgi:hypothetical protein